MTESNRKYKKLSVSHNKSKSGSGSIIKFNVQDNIFKIKSGNFMKGKYFKKFKSISPTIQRRNYNNVIIKEKKKKSKSQSRSKTKSKIHYNKNDLYELNNLIINGKYNNNSNKQKSFKEKMDSILSKNIIALTKKIRKSPSPKIRISRPTLIKTVFNNPQNKIGENLRQNLNYRNNIYSNGAAGKKNKNPSPISFRISNNSNYIYNTNTNYNNKKLILCLNNNCHNNDNLLLINNTKKASIKKKKGSSPNNIGSQNSCEHYDNSCIKGNDKITYQNSCSNKVKNFTLKNRSSFGPRGNNINNIGNINQKNLNKKIKNIENINKKNMNVYKYDDYNSLNEKKRNINVNIQQCNKKPSINKNSFVGNMININKNIIINDINKKNNIVINNINNINSNTNKKQMTIIQNFSKYKKKGTSNINSINNNNNACNKNHCHKENISNNYFDDNKINEGNDNKKKILNLNNVGNRTIDEKRKKNEYNHSQPKTNDNTNNCYTN